jgi:predicted aldo/keto reductase-like oxidoreductase
MMERREFIKTVTAATGAPLVAGGFMSAEMAGAAEVETLPTWQGPQTMRGDMPYRPLGRTGEQVSLVGLGGFHIGRDTLNDEESLALIRSAIDHGINFMDNSWDYNQGRSEIRMGRALRDGYRDKVFLMTKIDGRTKAAAAQQIDESLKRLQTDHLDLLQHHEIIRLEDPDRVFASGGAMEAVQEAKQAGKLRFIGFTGHKDPLVHLRMLEIAARHDFHFDTAQMPLNVMDAHFRSFAHLVVPVLVREQIGVLGMKSMANGLILNSKTVTPVECLHYAMSLPTSTVINGIDSPMLLTQALNAAKTFRPLGPEDMQKLLARTAKAAESGEFELFKTSTRFDSTAHNPSWLGQEAPVS